MVKPFVDIFTQEPIRLLGFRLLDPSADKVVENSSMVIERGIITDIGYGVEVGLPGVRTLDIDLTGKTVMPGLVMLHEHIFYPSKFDSLHVYANQYYSAPKLYLAKGVTTSRTAGCNHPFSDLALVDDVTQYRQVGPRMHMTAPYLDGPLSEYPQNMRLRDGEDAYRSVLYWFDRGFTNFKLYKWATAEIAQASINAAHSVGAKITGHLCAVTFEQAIDMGIDCLEHGLMVDTEFVPTKEYDVCPLDELVDAIAAVDVTSPRVDALIARLVESGTAVTSTLPVFETLVPGRPDPPPGAFDAMLPEAAQVYRAKRARIDQDVNSSYTAAFANEMAFEKRLFDAGGLLLAGTDPTSYGGNVPGFGSHRELELLVEAGFTPLEALRIATLHGAMYLEEDDCVGSIGTGMLADLLVLDGNPATNIADISTISTVFRAGIGYNPDRLLQAIHNDVSWT
eukprot:CAMPEP_0119132238 /NCGR_PEP_ID=MMETSP1310-20130426/11730_1 /TAXON_ID=464262 /ORGANISM="Genus nov. species nov., Strain RCC2339" /LENGTH=452 /DNA_ID=CAMNT_0007122861 /DNA_START=172 /DNA_END=1530 /DNA_ORIENTATION=-